MLLRTAISIPFLCMLLVGCAGKSIFDTTRVDKTLTPKFVLDNPQQSSGKVALWGGTILDTQNLQDATQIEVLAYPLNKSNRPRLKQKPLGRFIIVQPGFLEPTVYAQGLSLSVLGSVRDTQQGSVGESQYRYPVISAQKLHLWSPRDESSRTSFHFGLGIGL